MSHELAQLTVEQRNDVTVARLSGEIDISNAADLAATLLASVPNSSHGLVLDLAELRYLDSAGVNLLFNLTRLLDRRQQRHCIASPGGAVREVLEMTATHAVTPLVGSVDDGVAALLAR
jgi:anti-sigma B factor antagonist